METSLIVALGTLGVDVLEGIISYFEGTFRRGSDRHMHMAFCWNWAICVGIPLFALVNLFAVDSIVQEGFPWYDYVLSFVAGWFVTEKLFKSWWNKDENLGHVFRNWEQSGGDSRLWSEDITLAGVVHYFYMTAQTAILILFLISFADRLEVLIVGFLFFVFLSIQNLQAKVVQRSFNGFVFTLELMALVVVAVWKLW